MSTTPNDTTFEALVARVAALEQTLASLQPHLLTPVAPPPASTMIEKPTDTRRFLRRAVAAAASLVGALLKVSSRTAFAAENNLPGKSNPCICSSAEASVPAVRATGTNGANGVDTSSDSGVALDATSDSGVGVHGQSNSDTGVLGQSNSQIGVAGQSNNIGVYGTANNIGVYGQGFGDNSIGVSGESDSNTGVSGQSPSGIGVSGRSPSGTGVQGQSSNGTAVSGFSASGTAVSGSSYSGTAVYGRSTEGLAGLFDGSVQVNGQLLKPGGGFQIDHPLDAAHKYLSHSFVESPDMKNLYDGVVTLDANGQAEVRLPDWFETLNTDVRYQLTCLGGYAPVYIAEKLQHNRFTIAGGQAGMEVSWQVTGIRQDPWASANRIVVEQDKPTQEQGYYLHPDLYGEPEEKHILQGRYPELQRPVLPQK